MKLTLTKNFYTWLRTILLQTNTQIGATTTNVEHNGAMDVLGSFVDVNGVEKTAFGSGRSAQPYGGDVASLNAWANGSNWYAYRFSYVWFGVGNSNIQATEDDYTVTDYTIEEDYNISCRALSNPLTTDEGKAKLTYSVIVTAVNNITICEIGMFKSFLPTTLSSPKSTDIYDVLLGRATLDTPIELKAGESATFQIDIEI